VKRTPSDKDMSIKRVDREKERIRMRMGMRMRMRIRMRMRRRKKEERPIRERSKRFEHTNCFELCDSYQIGRTLSNAQIN
jgi:hypothetical protein